MPSEKHAQLPPDLPGASALYERASTENFPVASRILPKDARSHLMAIYGFARLADELGDSLPGDRLGALDWLEEELERSASGNATHPVLERLGTTIEACDLPLDSFRRLIEANRRDQVVHSYETFEDLVGYCELSAVPVGRLVLAVLGANTPDRVEMSDGVCIGLQVVEHLQDVAEDAANGRVYLPEQDLRRFACESSELVAPRASAGLRRVIAVQVEKARKLLLPGIPLARSLPMRSRVAVAGFVAGGLSVLDAVSRADYDVLGSPTRPTRRGFGAHLLQVLSGRGQA